MNYYKVAPLIYFGQDASVLTYHSSEGFLPGQAVLIPLRQKQVIGIVLDKTNKPRFETKEIQEKIFVKPILNEALLKTAFWISNYYSASLVSVLQTMVPSGITKKRRITNSTEYKIPSDKPPKLTPEQEKIVNKILTDKKNQKHLIFGVTGSGKTEVYLRLIEASLKKNQQAIMLVPEVSLTPQALTRFVARFGNQVTILHSYLKETERFANWKDIFEGKKSVVVGSRSALFAPFSNLGLIIIDEEHENSYKQDQTPRYQTVKVAEKIIEFNQAKLILGSATPSINSFYAAQNDLYQLHLLNKRIVQDFLPEVEIIDMRNEFQAGNKSIFSDCLIKNIKQTLNEKRQVLLFINRRGMSTFVSCRDCGYVAKCPHCDIPLTFHYYKLKLICHHCGYQENIPTLCPQCQGSAIKYFGTGTQRVEQELKKLIGHQYKIGRMDRDTIQKRGSHENIYQDFTQKKVDILIGTQMITKGWDLTNVSLVGIISADTMTNFPDYNASERTFNLLTQVAGRTGRGEDPGKVILQTYNPDNSTIKFASQHDFISFYNQEIKNRQELNYPPFTHLIKLMYNNPVLDIAEDKAKTLADQIKRRINKPKVILIGPSPAFLPKLAGKYRWQIILKILSHNEKVIISLVKQIEELTKNEWSIDVDPIGII
jgi:primosomal protein N' (replication factor Y)